MLTLITGTPGAGKSLYAVWELANKVPGSTVESDQGAVPRKLYSNIKDLLVEHTHIEAADLETWHTWAKPGDVILYDEVQEVWRPRGMGTKVPDCIAKLETHRHMGVDIILVTQHPMLVDPNIRRLVNQHIHMRRITRTVAMAYEWDHCANPGQTRSAINSKVWWHPKAAYKLYKSAQLHTKPTVRLPKILIVGLAALAGLAYVGPMAYGRITGAFEPGHVATNQVKPVGGVVAPPSTVPLPVASAGGVSAPQPGMNRAGVVGGGAAGVVAAPPVFAGCIAKPGKCDCYDQAGYRVEADLKLCDRMATTRAVPGVALPGQAWAEPPNQDDLRMLAFLKDNRGPQMAD